MSICVDLKRLDYKKTKDKIIEVSKTKDEEMVDKILLQFGTKIDNDYIVLNNEYWEDSNCYYRLIEFLDKYFKLDDLGYDCLIRTGKDTVDYVDIETVCDNLGIESDFMYDEEDE